MKLQTLFLISLIFTCILAGPFKYKHPQGAPSGFDNYKPPVPEETATHSAAAILDIDFKGKQVWQAELPVDADEELTISIVSPIYEHLDVQIMQPGSKLMNVHNLAKEIEEDFGIDGARFPSHTFLFPSPAKGIWQVKVTCTNAKAMQTLKSKQKADLPEGKIIASNYSPYKVAAHLASLETIKDEKVGFELRLIDDSTPKTSLLHDPLVGLTLSVELDVTEPNGQEITVTMNDNGLLGDRVANDGIYYGQINADQSGRYISQMIVTGKDPLGNPLLRTTEIAFNVITDSIDVTGAYANYDQDNQVFDIYLRLEQSSLLKDESQNRFKVWSQVWGENSQKQMVAVGWVSGFTELEKDSNGNTVLGRIELNHRWVANAGVVSNLQLRNLRIRDADWSVIIDNIPTLNIDAQIPELRLTQNSEPLDVITHSMKFGWEAEKYIKNVKTTDDDFRMTLIHGYCAQSDPWPVADFDNAIVFSGGLKQSLSNDEFSRRVISFLMAQGVNSSSFVAHSQGGMVSTHTFNYYITALDGGLKKKQRIIQTVGTPYQGSNLAGSVASLGDIFGVGCGANNDLTLAGAKAWLSDISYDSRELVNFYFTRYGDTGLIKYCSLPANAVLKWPNDGTTEVEYATLAGGQNQPSNPTLAWCHTTGMSHPAQYTDAKRNKEMSKYANTDKN